MGMQAATHPRLGAPVGVTESQDATSEGTDIETNSNIGKDQYEGTGDGVESPDDFDVDLDELVNTDFGDDNAMQGQHKGLNYHEVLKHIPENGRKVIQNLRSSYTQKTQEIAELKRSIEAEREELNRQRELLSNSDFAMQVNQLAQQQPQHDAWSDEGLEERINQKAALMMQKMLSPLQQDLEVQKRQVQLESFKSKNPDLVSEEVRLPVAKLLMQRPELKLEDAYYIVKAQQMSDRTEQTRQSTKQVLKKTSTGTAVNSAQPPKFTDAWSAYQWHKSQIK